MLTSEPISPSRPATSRRATNRQHATQLLLNGLLLGGWGWLYAPLFDYFTTIFSREDFRTNQVLLVAVLALIGLQIRRGDLRFRLHAPPQLRVVPLIAMLGGSIFYLVGERFLAINTLSATFFGLATYGLLGLWLAPARWRQGLPAALLLIGTLPFGEHLQTFIGYPMRLATAALVRDGLLAAGVGSVGVDTILIFENGVSQIDLPCSGVKSLWTGTLFLLAATWLERRRLDLRWLGVAVLLMALLFVANLARVAMLVVAGPVLGWNLLAEMVHVPLGVLGFGLACGAAALLLRRLPGQGLALLEGASQKPGYSTFPPPRRRVTNEASEAPSPQKRGGLGERSDAPSSLNYAGGYLFSLALVTAVAVMALLYTPRPQDGLTQPPLDWTFPAAFSLDEQPLTADETFWLTRDGAESAERWYFRYRSPGGKELSGTLMVVVSETWRAHHHPERCFEVHGLALDNSYAHLVAPDFPVRIAQLSDGDQQWTAAYWFQASDRLTDDYTTRIWADVSLRPRRWVLVTMVFEDAPDVGSAGVQSFYTALREVVAQTLN